MKLIKFYRYLLPFWKIEALILGLSGFTVVLGLINPYLTKLIIDKAYGNRDLKLFIILVGICGIIFILSGLLSAASNYLNRHMRLKINFQLNRKVFQKLQQSPYSFFQGASGGEHLYKLNYDIEQASRFLADTLPQAISLIPKSIFILIIIFYLNSKIALLALALTSFLYIVPLYFNQRLKKTYKIWIENSQGIFKRLYEIFSHMQLVKAFGREKSELRDYIRKLIENIRFSLKSAKVEVAGLFANSLASRIVLGAIIFYGGYQVIKGKMTLGALSAISIYLNQLSGLQGSLAQFIEQVSLGAVSWDRLDAILEMKAELIENKFAGEAIFSKGGIEFRGVTFGYKSDNPVLDNLSFHINGGSAIALVGPSGCGKTTVANLILRLYPLNKGQILIDGHNIYNIKSRSFYGQIGIVLQEPYLWDDTVENNIKYGRENATFEEVREASRVACADEFINSFPLGYDTIIGENACKISEGQKQRIAIARAIIKRPKISILDEALSSVDAQIEARIINNIRSWLKGATLLVISHRLCTIKSMDLVYFLATSRRMDVATHTELSRTNPEYHSYLAHQLNEENFITAV